MDALLVSDFNVAVAEDFRHGHVGRVLEQNPGLEVAVVDAVTGRHGVVARARKSKGEGLTADSLNASLKSSFRRQGGWSFEATVREGVIFDSVTPDTKVEGFDLARYDARANVARLWSLCFGRRPLATGTTDWSRYRERHPDLTELLDWADASGVVGEDLDQPSDAGTVLGDIQFGNWGLGYRDMLRLIDADDQIRVDMYVYVTGSEGLNRFLSDGIVTFRQTVTILRQFPRLIRLPVWVIGLTGARAEPESMSDERGLL